MVDLFPASTHNQLLSLDLVPEGGFEFDNWYLKKNQTEANFIERKASAFSNFRLRIIRDDICEFVCGASNDIEKRKQPYYLFYNVRDDGTTAGILLLFQLINGCYCIPTDSLLCQ